MLYIIYFFFIFYYNIYLLYIKYIKFCSQLCINHFDSKIYFGQKYENHKRLKRLRSSRPRCTSKTEVSNKFQEG